MKAACLSCGRKNNLSGRSSKWSFCLPPRYRYTVTNLLLALCFLLCWHPAPALSCQIFQTTDHHPMIIDGGGSNGPYLPFRCVWLLPATCLTTKEDRRHQANAISNKAVAFLPVSFAQLEINRFRHYQEETRSMEQQVWRYILDAETLSVMLPYSIDARISNRWRIVLRRPLTEEEARYRAATSGLSKKKYGPSCAVLPIVRCGHLPPSQQQKKYDDGKHNES